MAAVTLIREPLFVVDLGRYREVPHNELPYRVYHFAIRVFREGYFLITAFPQAIIQNTYVMGNSFLDIVLSRGRIPPNITKNEIIFRVALWVVYVVASIFVSTISIYLQNRRQIGSSAELSAYCDARINPAHIITKDKSIDISEVPASVTVDQLEGIFDGINFTNPSQLGYMPPSSRQEGLATISVENLRSQLNTFVTHVNSRTPFLGTPPGYNLPKFHAFYDQVERAVRYSIHKSDQEIAAFKQSKGDDVSRYSVVDQGKYTELLHKRARIALNLAIAGGHCGGRYMGEAMSLYYDSQGDGLSGEETLSETLQEVLAHKRKELAEIQIAQRVQEVGWRQSTHIFSQYMRDFGPVLAIPGGENVVEHLSAPSNYVATMRDFFGMYSPDAIKEAIQNKVKTSQAFREKIYDWLKTQASHWNRAHYDEIVNAVCREALQVAPEETPVISAQMTQLISTYQTIKGLPSMDNWNDFLEDLFAHQSVKGQVPDRTQRQSLKDFCSQPCLKAELQAALRGEPHQSLHTKMAELGRVKKINAILTRADLTALDTEVLLRAVTTNNLGAVIKAHIESKQQADFLEALNLETAHENGLPPDILEWLLVAQGILFPQLVG